MSHGTGTIAGGNSQDVTVIPKYFQQNCATKKSKRIRSAFSTEQINCLEREFRKFPYIGSGNRKEISNKLNITERAVKIWFQNRRMREKKESFNNECDIEDRKQNATIFTNEQLKHAPNWLSNNDHHSPIKEGKASGINISIKPFARDNTEPCNTTLKETFCTPHKVVGVSPNHFPSSTLSASENSIQMDAAHMFQKGKNKLNASCSSTFKRKTVGSSTKDSVNFCPMSKSHMSSCQKMPQDISSRRIINKFYPHQPYYYPVNPIPGSGFMPLYIQNPYAPSTSIPGKVIWKPVNMVSTLPMQQPSAIPTDIPEAGAGVHLVNNNVKVTCSCNCNRHGTFVRGLEQVNKGHPQYVIAIPFSNHTQ